MALPALSLMPVAKSRRSSLRVPVPVMPLTVTSKTVPLAAETEAIVPATVPVVVRMKSLASTPFTASPKVTRKTTLATLVVAVVGFWRLMETTDGAVSSIVTVKSGEVRLLGPAPSEATAVKT